MKIHVLASIAILSIWTPQTRAESTFFENVLTSVGKFSDRELPTKADAVALLQKAVSEKYRSDLIIYCKTEGMTVHIEDQKISEKPKEFPENAKHMIFVEGPHFQREGMLAQNIDFRVLFDSDGRLISWSYWIYTLAL